MLDLQHSISVQTVSSIKHPCSFSILPPQAKQSVTSFSISKSNPQLNAIQDVTQITANTDFFIILSPD
jgi:hypothetical protein